MHDGRAFAKRAALVLFRLRLFTVLRIPLFCVCGCYGDNNILGTLSVFLLLGFSQTHEDPCIGRSSGRHLQPHSSIELPSII
jgi:hypothetical protein